MPSILSQKSRLGLLVYELPNTKSIIMLLMKMVWHSINLLRVRNPLFFDIVHHGLRDIPRRSLHPAVQLTAKGVVLGEHCMRVDETIHYKTVFIRLNIAVLTFNFLTFNFSDAAFISESHFLNHWPRFRWVICRYYVPREVILKFLASLLR